jgi:hypothetical protein
MILDRFFASFSRLAFGGVNSGATQSRSNSARSFRSKAAAVSSATVACGAPSVANNTFIFAPPIRGF